MRIFSWVQSKLNGRQGNLKISNAVSVNHHMEQEPVKEEFSDWPHGLLAIGTFGNNDLKENPEIQSTQEKDPWSPQDLLDFTPEEVGKLQKELTKLLKRKPACSAELKEIADLPLARFLNCPSSLEVDRRICNSFCSNSDESDRVEDIDRTISVLLGRCKDVCVTNGKKSIGKKLISFLPKKMFVCTGGFAPVPSLRDTLQESRMEKILRTILHKKLYSQNSTQRTSMWKSLEHSKQMQKRGSENEAEEKATDACKWDKTDSEYIVLEI